MTTKTAVITGATSGLGEAAAVALAAEGWRVLVVGRDAARGAAVAARAGHGAEFLAADLFTAEGARALAAAVRARCPTLDLLVNNAGGSFARDARTADGVERTFALNVLAPFALTEALVDLLAASKGRVVNVATDVPKGATADLAAIAGASAGAGLGAYTKAKLCVIGLTREQQRRYGPRGVTVVSLHPGIIPDTRFGAEMPGWVRAVGGFVARAFGMASTTAQAAARYVRLATADVVGGGWYRQDDAAPTAPPAQAGDDAFTADLWARLAAMSSARSSSTVTA